MADPRPDSDNDIRTPRWVKLSAIIGGAVLLLIAIMMLAGHGPGSHMPSAH